MPKIGFANALPFADVCATTKSTFPPVPTTKTSKSASLLATEVPLVTSNLAALLIVAPYFTSIEMLVPLPVTNKSSVLDPTPAEA